MEARATVWTFDGAKFEHVVKCYHDRNAGMIHVEMKDGNTKDFPVEEFEHIDLYVVETE